MSPPQPNLARLAPETLHHLQRQDGKLWRRILGEWQAQYREIPFWVLLANPRQLEDAILYLQRELAVLQSTSDHNVTVAFTTRTAHETIWYGMLEGDELFRPEALRLGEREPTITPRRHDIFDSAYPGDP